MPKEAHFVLSKSKMLKQYKTVAGVADKVSYSFKTNPTVGALLEKFTDCSFTVQSIRYLSSIKDKKRVWFLVQGIDKDEMKALIRKGVNSFIVDNKVDLDTVLAYLSRHNCKINLMLRMRMKERTVKTEKHYVYGMFSSEINELIPKLRENKSISALGVHFHRKTENIGEWDIQQELMELLHPATLKCIDLIDIGGGIPVEYNNYSAQSLSDILVKIKQARKWANGQGIKLIAEPGRFIAAPCIELKGGVVSVNGGTIILNCSVYNCAMDTIVANIKLQVKGEVPNGRRYLIKGCTPDSTDIFRYRACLREVKAGDTITFLNAGAYTYSTDFCALKPLKTLIVK